MNIIMKIKMAISKKKHKNLRNELAKMIIEDHPGLIEQWKYDQMVRFAMLMKYRTNAEAKCREIIKQQRMKKR